MYKNNLGVTIFFWWLRGLEVSKKELQQIPRSLTQVTDKSCCRIKKLPRTENLYNFKLMFQSGEIVSPCLPSCFEIDGGQEGFTREKFSSPPSLLGGGGKGWGWDECQLQPPSADGSLVSIKHYTRIQHTIYNTTTSISVSFSSFLRQKSNFYKGNIRGRFEYRIGFTISFIRFEHLIVSRHYTRRFPQFQSWMV